MPSDILPKMGHKSVWFHRVKSYKQVAPVRLSFCLVWDLTLVRLPPVICKFNTFCGKLSNYAANLLKTSQQRPRRIYHLCAIVGVEILLWLVEKFHPATNLSSLCSFQLNSASQRHPRNFKSQEVEKLCAVCYVVRHVMQVHKHPFER